MVLCRYVYMYRMVDRTLQWFCVDMCIYIYRPATHPDLIGISRFFSANLGVSRFPDSTCENPEFLFRFEIGKTKERLNLLHGPCFQTHKV